MRIVVDELPKYCGKCMFIRTGYNNERRCYLTQRTMATTYWHPSYVKENDYRPPPKCSLVALKDVVEKAICQADDERRKAEREMYDEQTRY